MDMFKLVSDRSLETALADLNDWNIEDIADGRPGIRRRIRFGSFGAATIAVSQIALMAERMDHCPERLTIYKGENVKIGEFVDGGAKHDINQVGIFWIEIVLSTHAAGGVTEGDLMLARFVDSVEASGAASGL